MVVRTLMEIHWPCLFFLPSPPPLHFTPEITYSTPFLIPFIIGTSSTTSPSLRQPTIHILLSLHVDWLTIQLFVQTSKCKLIAATLPFSVWFLPCSLYDGGGEMCLINNTWINFSHEDFFQLFVQSIVKNLMCVGTHGTCSSRGGGRGRSRGGRGWDSSKRQLQTALPLRNPPYFWQYSGYKALNIKCIKVSSKRVTADRVV